MDGEDYLINMETRQCIPVDSLYPNHGLRLNHMVDESHVFLSDMGNDGYIYDWANHVLWKAYDGHNLKANGYLDVNGMESILSNEGDWFLQDVDGVEGLPWSPRMGGTRYLYWTN